MSEEDFEKLKQEVKEVLKPEENAENAETEEAPQAQADYLEVVITLVRGFTEQIANWLGDPSLVLSENEEKMLRAGLEPFRDAINQNIEYIKYMPLVFFLIEYGGKVLNAYRRKRESGNIGNVGHGQNHPNEVLNSKTPVQEGSGGQVGNTQQGQETR